MAELDRKALRHALTAVGELLANENESVAIVVTGGATLSLLGIVDRATSDVDVIARAGRGEDGAVELEPPEPFPDALERAIHTVARDFELDEDWMNAVVGMQWSQGLPPWFRDEIEWTNYGAAWASARSVAGPSSRSSSSPRWIKVRREFTSTTSNNSLHRIRSWTKLVTGY